MCIQTGWIVWINGPFAPGDWPDLVLALEGGLVHMFEGDERAVADKGYRGWPEYFDVPWEHLDSAEAKSRKALARARHECTNRKFKEWKVLKEVFRHDLALHAKVFTAVANIVQVKIVEGGTWQVDYYDREENDLGIVVDF